MTTEPTGCPGKLRISGGSVGVCYSCGLYGQRGAQIEPAATIGLNGVWQCPNRVPAGLTAEQIAAMDEMAGNVKVAR